VIRARTRRLVECEQLPLYDRSVPENGPFCLAQTNEDLVGCRRVGVMGSSIFGTCRPILGSKPTLFSDVVQDFAIAVTTFGHKYVKNVEEFGLLEAALEENRSGVSIVSETLASRCTFVIGTKGVIQILENIRGRYDLENIRRDAFGEFLIRIDEIVWRFPWSEFEPNRIHEMLFLVVSRDQMRQVMKPLLRIEQSEL